MGHLRLLSAHILGISIILASAAPMNASDPSGSVPGISAGAGPTGVTPDGVARVPDEPFAQKLNDIITNTWVELAGNSPEEDFWTWRAKLKALNSMSRITKTKKSDRGPSSTEEFESRVFPLREEAQKAIRTAMGRLITMRRAHAQALVPPNMKLQTLGDAISMLKQQPEGKKAAATLEIQRLSQGFLIDEYSHGDTAPPMREVKEKGKKELEQAEAEVARAKLHSEWVDSMIATIVNKLKVTV